MTEPAQAPSSGGGHFDVGPASRLSGWWQLRHSANSWLPSAPIAAALLGWLPLALLAAARGDFINSGGPGPFLRDIAAHARYLVAVPLLVLGQPKCIARLTALARHFWNAGLVTDTDRERFDDVMTSIARRRDSTVANVGLIVIAYALVAIVMYSVSAEHMPAWHAAASGSTTKLSPAGWWHDIVSLPLLLILLLGWLYRLFLWARFLWLMSRLDLQLLPAHPDSAGGLGFAGDSINAHALLALSLGSVAAGTIASRVVNEGATLLSFKYLVLGLAVSLLVLVVAPLLAFGGQLVATWERSVLDFDAMADRVGREFERTWIGPAREFPEDPLRTQAFSALTDLFKLVSNVNAMRFIPIDVRSVTFLFVMTLLPFLPVIVMAVPLDVVVKDLMKFLI